jgi:imidazolonepropionase-like amidohydrolase
MVAYPWMYFEEIERFVEHGYTPLEVIVAATKINAEVCGASERLGTVEEGKLADLVVVDGDPLRDIKALRNTRIIIQEGKIIKN